MAGVELRNVATTATGSPIVKRAVVTLTDGRVVALFPDANYASASGTDNTGVAKIHLYISGDVSRTVFNMAAAYTPPVSPTNNGREGVMSLGAGADNSVWVAWQGVDNSLNVTRWSYSAGALTFVANEVVQAAGAITKRFRTIDMDIAGNATAAVMTYEANATTGNAAWHRVYVRNNAGAWVRAVNLTALANNQFIRTNSEDVSIAIRGDGVASNLIRFLIYGTKTHTTGDIGDVVREYSYNVSTAPADGGVHLGSWSTSFNKDQAAGTRRAMIFTLSSSIYLLAGVIGAGVPKFFATKLTSTAGYGPPVINTAGYVSTVALSNYFKIDPNGNQRTYWSASYKDNRLIFGFAGVGTGSAPRIFREVSMTWANVGSVAAKPTVDLVPRPLDSAYYGDSATTTALAGPIGIYGGDNRRVQANLKYYNFVAWYGPISNLVNSAGIWKRRLRFVSEDTFDAPVPIAPYSGAAEPTARPSYRVRVQNVNLQPNLYGKIEVQISSDTTFSVVKTITQADSAFQYFGSKDGLTGGAVQVTVPSSVASALTQGTWYWRARIVSDKDTPGAWSGHVSFAVAHPPTAQPIYPSSASVIADEPGNTYNFSWLRSDTEPTDSQTAYRVIVRRLDTFANVLDTGFVSSSASTVNLSLDANGLGILETPLDWQVQLKDADGVTGPLTVPVEFTIGDPPLLTVNLPEEGVEVTTALPTVTWSFQGYGMRNQRAFRIAIFENSTPNLLPNPSFETGTLASWTAVDSTAAVSTNQAHSGTYSALITPNGTGVTPRVEASGAGSMAVTPGQNYTATAWISPVTGNKSVLVGINWYDSSDVYISTSSATLAPVPGDWQKVTVSGDAPNGAATGRVHAGVGGTPAAGDQVYVDDVSFNVTDEQLDTPLVDTLWRSSTANSYTFTTQVLQDLSQYLVVVSVQDTGGLTATQTIPFRTNWTEPSLGGGMTAVAPDSFKVRVSWTEDGRDSDFVAYRVYRRYMKTAIAAFDIENTANTWFLLYETDEIKSSYAFDDYLAPLNKPIDYVVVQLVDRFGSLVESNITTFSTVTLAADRYYFVPEVLLGGIASFEASSVTGDNFTRDVEQESLHVVGRGRQMQIGDDLGYSGTLTIKLRNPNTARRDREFFELISSQYNKVYVKSPFGDVVLIALGNVGTTRQAGYGGHADFADLNVPYTEIIDESLTAREIGS